MSQFTHSICKLVCFSATEKIVYNIEVVWLTKKSIDLHPKSFIGLNVKKLLYYFVTKRLERLSLASVFWIAYYLLWMLEPTCIADLQYGCLWAGSWPCLQQKHLRDKNSSFFTVSLLGGKKVLNIEPWGQCYKTFYIHNLRIFIIS